MRHIILADKQEITAEGLLSIITRKFGKLEFTTVSDRRGLILSLRQFPDAVVIIDYSLFDFSVWNEMSNIYLGAKNSSWLLFQNDPGEALIRSLHFAMPKLNIVTKSERLEDIEKAINATMFGLPYLCDYAQSVISAPVPDNNKILLTPSEKIILHEISLGKTTKEIALEKNLSFHTINSHRRNIFRKLEVNNVHEAIRYAIKAGIIDVAEYYI